MQLKNKKSPLVSVIVPAYNEEKHIEECLVSIKKQTYSRIELIVIDDGSTDSTKSIARIYADIFLSQKHQGPGVARNKAAKLAKGEILVFVDADMYLDDNYVIQLVSPIFKSGAVATFTNEEYLANKNNIWAMCANIDNNIPQGLRMKTVTQTSGAARAIKKNVFMRIGGINPTLGYRDDHIFDKNNVKNIILAKGAICYHYNPGSLREVYESARWIGRNPLISTNPWSLVRYSFINSISNSFKRIKAGAPVAFLVYKLVFDLGIVSGVLVNNSHKNYAK